MAAYSVGAARGLTLGEVFASQIRVIFSLMLRQMVETGGNRGLGYLKLILQPIVMITIAALFMRVGNGVPPVGQSWTEFIASGLLPYRAFSYMKGELRNSAKPDSRILQLPPIQHFDSIFAAIILRIIMSFLIIAVILALFNAFGMEVYPDDPIKCSVALLSLLAFAIGFGLTFAPLIRVFPFMSIVYKVLAWKTIILSGIFFLPDKLPPDWLYYLSWNPILHGVSWFRSGFIMGYNPHFVDYLYLHSWSVGLIVLGLVLMRVFRNRIGDGNDEVEDAADGF